MPRRITGVQYLVTLDGKEYIAAWGSPYRVSLYERATRKRVASWLHGEGRGLFSQDDIAAASDAADRCRLKVA